MATIASQPAPTPAALEVRCAGCGETLEVEQGLTDFICPDCATPQSLPPELMPRKRKALPLPRGVDSTKIQLPCVSCNTPLNVPHGLSRFVCPKCQVELAVDHHMLKKFLVGSSEAAAALELIIPSAVKFPLPPLNTDPPPPSTLIHTTTPQRTLVSSHVLAENNTPTPLKAQLQLSTNIEQHNEVASSSGALVVTSINALKQKTQALSNTLLSSSTCVEEREEVAAPTPSTELIPGQRKRGRKCLAKHATMLTPPSPDNAVQSLRRSGRLAKTPPAESNKSEETQKKQVSSLLNQSQLGESCHTEGQLQPQDIARHYNELFSMDIGQLLTDTPQPHSETRMDRTSGSQHSPHMEPSSDFHSSPSLDPHLDLSSDPHHNLTLDSHPILSLDPRQKPSLDLQQVPSSELHPHHSPDDRFLAEPVTDNEGDEAYAEAELIEYESDQESLVLRALQRLRERTVDNAGAYKRGIRGRGPNRCREVWDRPDNDPFEVEFNDLGQPIGKESFYLASFLGIIARDGKLIPLNIFNWKEVPIELKETIWLIVKSKFRLQEVRRAYVMKALNRLWSNWKSVLKKRHYDIHDNDEARLADINKRVEPDQWPCLVRLWSSEEFQRVSAINKECRKKLKTVHTTGTKSFARIREEERMKKPNNEELSRAEMFILTRTRKDGTTLDEESAEIIARLQEELKKGEGSSDINSRNDLLANVLGGNDSRYVRTFGPLPLKMCSLGSSQTKGKMKKMIVAAATLPKNVTVEPMKDKMKEMEKRHKEMEEEMNRMRSTMMAMQQFISTQQHLPDQRGLASPGFSGGHTGI